ncbi:MAG: tetratricopeptide repeat protein [Pseudomonadota bacterium]
MIGLLRGGVLLLLLAASSFGAADAQSPALATNPAGYAAAESCMSCHDEQARAWKDSDHDWAMRKAEPSSVLGDFADTSFTDAGVETRFFRRAGQYFVHTEGEDGKPADFQILYTFGHRPLQQYLVAFPGGRLQALTVAWDSRPASAGGQRWFSLYPGQRFAPGDALHWTGRYQNWNAMCADCHSTQLEKGYDSQSDSFSTTWHEQNVGCQSCHGPAQAHVEWAQGAKSDAARESATAMGLSVDFSTLGGAGLIEQCAYCHSRRQGLGVAQQPGHPSLDAVLPATLRPDLYHPDGQIMGEVYVYGSYTQSKMYAAGVTCTDCHDPHSTQVRLEGNGVCLQCHNEQPPTTRFPSLQAKNYDSPEHHHHAQASSGSQCVNCHMPETTYMVVDPRRDHSIRIPRPDLAQATGSPDACTACHQDRNADWAVQSIDSWFDHPHRPAHYAQTFHALRTGQGDAVALLAQLIDDLGKPAIVRASAADQLADFGQAALPTLSKALADDSALVRAYAVGGFVALPPVQRVAHLLPLLDDPQRAVRDETLRALADIPLIALPAERREAFEAQLQDYEQRLHGEADLPGNRLNLAVFLERRGRKLEAMEQYRQALRMDPHFSPARVNLATLASQTLYMDEAEKVLRDGVALNGMPASDRGNLAYMLALLLVERGQPAEAATFMAEAAEAAPENARIRYNQGLLLLQMGKPDAAQQALESGLSRAPDDADLLYALIYLHGVSGRRELAAQYWQRLKRASPNDPRLEPLRSDLRIR